MNLGAIPEGVAFGALVAVVVSTIFAPCRAQMAEMAQALCRPNASRYRACAWSTPLFGGILRASTGTPCSPSACKGCEAAGSSIHAARPAGRAGPRDMARLRLASVGTGKPADRSIQARRRTSGNGIFRWCHSSRRISLSRASRSSAGSLESTAFTRFHLDHQEQGRDVHLRLRHLPLRPCVLLLERIQQSRAGDLTAQFQAPSNNRLANDRFGHNSAARAARIAL